MFPTLATQRFVAVTSPRHKRPQDTGDIPTDNAEKGGLGACGGEIPGGPLGSLTEVSTEASCANASIAPMSAGPSLAAARGTSVEHRLQPASGRSGSSSAAMLQPGTEGWATVSVLATLEVPTSRAQRWLGSAGLATFGWVSRQSGVVTGAELEAGLDHV